MLNGSERKNNLCAEVGFTVDKWLNKFSAVWWDVLVWKQQSTLFCGPSGLIRHASSDHLTSTIRRWLGLWLDFCLWYFNWENVTAPLEIYSTINDRVSLKILLIVHKALTTNKAHCSCHQVFSTAHGTVCLKKKKPSGFYQQIPWKRLKTTMTSSNMNMGSVKSSQHTVLLL